MARRKLTYLSAVKLINVSLAYWNSMVVPTVFKYQHRRFAPQFLINKFPRFFGLRAGNPQLVWCGLSEGVKNLDNFEHISLAESRLVQVLLKSVFPNDNVVDLGGNQGRFSAEIAGVEGLTLTNVDIWAEALELSKKRRNLAALGARYITKCQTFETFLSNADDREFDILFSRGATIELIPNDYPLVRELARVVKREIVLMIKPLGHFTPRLYVYEFQKYGFLNSLIVECDDVNTGVMLFKFSRAEELR